MDYPILKELYPYALFTPPICRPVIAAAGAVLHPPRRVWRCPEVGTERVTIAGAGGGEVELLLFTPKGLPSGAPCLLNFHGGGFVMEGASYHYDLAMAYAARTPCRVVFVRYRLAPRHPFPTPWEDGWAALEWVCRHSAALGIDRERVGISGDSAGGNLAAALCLMARDRGLPAPLRLQMLLYPVLDWRLDSPAARKFSGAPMWNTKLSRRVKPMVFPGGGELGEYASPALAPNLAGLPPAYLEAVQFDSLRDDALLYARRLREAGTRAEVHRVRGAMHGFDIVLDAPVTRECVARRVEFLRRAFTIRA